MRSVLLAFYMSLEADPLDKNRSSNRTFLGIHCRYPSSCSAQILKSRNNVRLRIQFEVPVFSSCRAPRFCAAHANALGLRDYLPVKTRYGNIEFPRNEIVLFIQSPGTLGGLLFN